MSDIIAVVRVHLSKQQQLQCVAAQLPCCMFERTVEGSTASSRLSIENV